MVCLDDLEMMLEKERWNTVDTDCSLLGHRLSIVTLFYCSKATLICILFRIFRIMRAFDFEIFCH